MRRRWRGCPDRSRVAVSGETSEREGASGPDADPSASRVGARQNRAGEHGPRAGQELWGAATRVQCAQHESGESRGLSPELQRALEPLLAGIETLSEHIREYNERIEQLAQESYPQVALLKQVKGVGTLIALTFLLTLEDAHRFRKSRDVGCYLGLQPGRRNSGQSEPQLHISKEGDPYLRTLLVQGAHHILGPFGADSDLRRWGLKLAERGGKNGKKRAVIATARKLAVLLHRLWVSGEVYEPLRNSSQAMLPAAA